MSAKDKERASLLRAEAYSYRFDADWRRPPHNAALDHPEVREIARLRRRAAALESEARAIEAAAEHEASP